MYFCCEKASNNLFQTWKLHRKRNHELSFRERYMISRLGQANRFCPTPPKSLCPCPIRPLSTKKGHENTGNPFPCNPKIWIFHDFQAKSQLYAVKQKLQLFLN